MATNTKKLGILGDGQLAQMLAESALAMGYNPLVYATSEDHPACKTAKQIVLGSMDDIERLREFFSKVDVVAFENEFLDCEILLEASKDLPVRIYPRLPILEHLQDKLNQKYLFRQMNLPSSDFMTLDDRSEESVDEALSAFSSGVVLKWSRMGYDGKGVYLVNDIEKEKDEILRFVETGFSRGAEVYAEEKVKYFSELAVVATRSASGKFVCYPLMISEQQEGICKKVYGPASRFGLSASLQNEVSAMAQKFANSVEMVGTFALELFLTSEGEILINEAAPRVHNSGHYSQDACVHSQFDNHWHALLDEELKIEFKKPVFGMINLLGPDNVQTQAAQVNVLAETLKETSEIYLHWYNKNELRALRKMGHLNVTANSKSELEDRMKEAQILDELWVKSFSRKG